MKMESGSEVKMPAAEEEDLTWENFDQFPASSRTGRINRIRDIQRRTILACAEWYRDRGGYGDIVGELQRMAASLQEKK